MVKLNKQRLSPVRSNTAVKGTWSHEKRVLTIEPSAGSSSKPNDLTQHAATVVMFPGLGSSAEYWEQELVKVWAPQLPNVRIVCLTPDVIKVPVLKDLGKISPQVVKQVVDPKSEDRTEARAWMALPGLEQLDVLSKNNKLQNPKVKGTINMAMQMGGGEKPDPLMALLGDMGNMVQKCQSKLAIETFDNPNMGELMRKQGLQDGSQQEKWVMETISKICSDFSDGRPMFFAGHSLGAYYAMRTAVHMQRLPAPRRCSGVLAISGFYANWDQMETSEKFAFPILQLHGAKDDVIDINVAKQTTKKNLALTGYDFDAVFGTNGKKVESKKEDTTANQKIDHKKEAQGTACYEWKSIEGVDHFVLGKEAMQKPALNWLQNQVKVQGLTNKGLKEHEANQGMGSTEMLIIAGVVGAVIVAGVAILVIKKQS